MAERPQRSSIIYIIDIVIEGQFVSPKSKQLVNGRGESRTQILFLDHQSFLVPIIFMICCNNEYCSINSLLISTFQMPPFNLSLFVLILLLTIYTWVVLKIHSCILFPFLFMIFHHKSNSLTQRKPQMFPTCLTQTSAFLLPPE